MIKHCYKDSKTSDEVDIVYEPMDEVITVRQLDSLKNKNVLEIMFPHHSILLSFKSFTTMERWLSELSNITSKGVCMSVCICMCCNGMYIIQQLVFYFRLSCTYTL